MKQALPGFLVTLLLAYIATSVWYDSDIFKTAHSAIFGFGAVVFLGIGIYAYGKK